MRRRPLGFPDRLLLGGVLLFFAAFLAYPLLFTLRNAFGLAGEPLSNPLTLVLSNPLLRQSLWNSLGIATVTVFLASGIALALALITTRLEFAGRGFFSGALLAPILLPPFVGAIGLQQVLARYGALNLFFIHRGWMDSTNPIDWLGAGGVPGIVVLQVLHFYPVLFLTLTAALHQLDPSLYECASSLGASRWREFRTITLPLIRPGWMNGAIIVWIGAFTDLGTPLITGYSRVLPVQIFDSLNDLNTSSQGYALVATTLLVIALLFVATRRFAGTTVNSTPARGIRAIRMVAGPIRTGWIWAGFGVLLTGALAPHLAVLVVSLSQHWFFSVLPDSWTLANFREVTHHGLTTSSVVNSLHYASLSSVVDFALGLGIAWLLCRRDFRFAGWMDAMAMLPLAIPGLVLAFGFFAGFEVNDRRHPWLDSWVDPRTNPTFLLIISYAIRRLPYMVRAAFAGFQQVNPALEEASTGLGAAPSRTFLQITLPLLGPHLIAGMILTFSFAMLEVSDSLILAQRDRFYPITKQIWQLTGRIDPGAPAVACALGVLGMALLAVSLFAAGRLLGRRSSSLFQA